MTATRAFPPARPSPTMWPPMWPHDATGTEANTPPSDVELVGRRDLRHHTGEVLARTIEVGRTAAVTNRNRIEAYLVPAGDFEALREQADELERLQGVLPLLLAAADANVALPSETLGRLGVAPPLDWRALNAFQAAYPVELTHGEDGEPLPPVTEPPVHQPVEEGEEELDLG